MNRYAFEKLVPPMPDGFKDRMNRTIQEVESMSKIRIHKRRVTLAIALITALALATAAYAATKSDLLAHLFAGKAAPPAARQQLVAPGRVFEAGGIRLTIDEYLRTEDQLTVFWTVESTLDEPVLYCADRPVLGGKDPLFNEYSQDVDGFNLYLLGDEAHSAPGKTRTGYITANLGEDYGVARPGEPLVFTLTARLFRPLAELVVPAYGQAHTVLVRDSQGCELYPDDGRLYVFDAGGGEVLLQPSQHLNAGDDARAQYLLDRGYARQVAEVTAEVSIGPARAESRHTRPDGTARFDQDDFSLEVLQLDFADGSTTARMRIWFPKGGQAGGLADMWREKYTIDILDERGNPLLPGESGQQDGWWLYMPDEVDGCPALCVEGKWRPLAQAPQRVIFAPSLSAPRADGSGVMDQIPLPDMRMPVSVIVE